MPFHHARPRGIDEVMSRRNLCGMLGGSLALLGFGALVTAAPLDLQRTKKTTEDLTRKNAFTLIAVSSAVPDELHIEVIEVVQALELSRDRIILFLDRIESGVYPAEEGVKRAVAIAQAEAQKEKEFLAALKERVPPPAIPKVEEALMVSAESWDGVLTALQRSHREEERGLPSRPGTGVDIVPMLFPIPGPASQ